MNQAYVCFGADPTKITQGPVDMEIIVGESIVLPCQISCDPALDVSFSWAFNGQLLNNLDQHYEHVGGVSHMLLNILSVFILCHIYCLTCHITSI